MKSEFQFIMAPDDESEFEDFVASLQLTIEPGKGYDIIRIGDEAIQFIRSELVARILMSGRIAVLSDEPEVGRTYRKLRAWLKNRYVNDLIAFQRNNPEKSTPVNYVWLGPGANRLLSDDAITLMDFAASNVGFARACANKAFQSVAPKSLGTC